MAPDLTEAGQAVTEHPGLAEWIHSGQRIAPSSAIVDQVTLGAVRDPGDFPRSAEDFRRCELLLRQVPTLRDEMHQMVGVGMEWAALVGRWADVVAHLEAELGPELAPGPAPRTHDLMQAIVHEAWSWQGFTYSDGDWRGDR